MLQEKKFFLGSQNLLRTNKSSYRTMFQLRQRSLSLWLSVRRSWTESGGFLDKQMWTPSSPDITPMDLAIWFIFEKDVSTRYYPILDSLEVVIQSAWAKVGRKSGVTFLRFCESPPQTHHQSKRWSF